MMTINYGLTKLSYHAIIHRHERSAPYRGVEQLAASLTAAGGRGREGAACAAVDKIEEKRKPEDFIGYRKRDARRAHNPVGHEADK